MYELRVEGMSCGHCVKTVMKSVLAVDSAAKVAVDLANKKVRVDTGAGLNAVKSALTEAGYPVTASNPI